MYSNKESTPPFCNTTHITDQNQKKKLGIDYDQKRLGDCNRLHERFNALTRDKNLLENRNTELNNRIMTLEEERDRLKMILRGKKKIGLSHQIKSKLTSVLTLTTNILNVFLNVCLKHKI